MGNKAIEFVCLYFWAIGHTWRSKYRLLMRGGEHLLLSRGRIASRSACGKTPMKPLHSTPIAVSESGHTGKSVNSLKPSSTRKSASQVVFSRMQLTLHATLRTTHGASRLVKAVSAWSVKTGRAPSRHCRDARVHGHTTTAMHDVEYTPLSRRHV